MKLKKWMAVALAAVVVVSVVGVDVETARADTSNIPVGGYDGVKVPATDSTAIEVTQERTEVWEGSCIDVESIISDVVYADGEYAGYHPRYTVSVTKEGSNSDLVYLRTFQTLDGINETVTCTITVTELDSGNNLTATKTIKVKPRKAGELYAMSSATLPETLTVGTKYDIASGFKASACDERFYIGRLGSAMGSYRNDVDASFTVTDLISGNIVVESDQFDFEADAANSKYYIIPKQDIAASDAVLTFSLSEDVAMVGEVDYSGLEYAYSLSSKVEEGAPGDLASVSYYGNNSGEVYPGVGETVNFYGTSVKVTLNDDSTKTVSDVYLLRADDVYTLLTTGELTEDVAKQYSSWEVKETDVAHVNFGGVPCVYLRFNEDGTYSYVAISWAVQGKNSKIANNYDDIVQGSGYYMIVLLSYTQARVKALNETVVDLTPFKDEYNKLVSEANAAIASLNLDETGYLVKGDETYVYLNGVMLEASEAGEVSGETLYIATGDIGSGEHVYSFYVKNDGVHVVAVDSDEVEEVVYSDSIRALIRSLTSEFEVAKAKLEAAGNDVAELEELLDIDAVEGASLDERLESVKEAVTELNEELDEYGDALNEINVKLTSEGLTAEEMRDCSSALEKITSEIDALQTENEEQKDLAAQYKESAEGYLNTINETIELFGLEKGAGSEELLEAANKYVNARVTVVKIQDRLETDKDGDDLVAMIVTSGAVDKTSASYKAGYAAGSSSGSYSGSAAIYPSTDNTSTSNAAALKPLFNAIDTLGKTLGIKIESEDVESTLVEVSTEIEKKTEAVEKAETKATRYLKKNKKLVAKNKRLQAKIEKQQAKLERQQKKKG